MSHRSGEPPWLQAEREFDDEIIGDGTIPELFEEAAARNLDDEAQRYKGGVYERSLTPDVVPPAPDGEFASLTYADYRRIVRFLAAGFRELGVGTDDRVAMYADTRMEWAQADLALLAAGAVVTTVYTESSPRTVEYLLDDPGATGVVVENADLAETLVGVEDAHDLAFIVVMDDPDPYPDRDDVYTLAEVYGLGEAAFDEDAYRAWIDEREPDDLASLIYTSGTTGRPKGVRLTHDNFRQNINGIWKRAGPRPDKDPDAPTLGPDTTSISFLPLAHVYERTIGHFLMIAAGATVGYAESPDTVAEDLTQIRPTYGASVPRVYERIYEAMGEQAGDAGLRRRIFDWSLAVSREYQRTNHPGTWLRLRHWLADRLVYRTVRGRMGGKIEYLSSGGGSLSRDLAETFLGMGITIIEGYGLTETAPVVSTNPTEDVRPGTLGPPLVNVDVRLDDAVLPPDEFQDASGEVGELQVQGPNVTDGYWNKPDETDRAFTDDGWFRTGDIIEQTDDGYLIFHDRLKQLMVLSTGKNIAPGPIEDQFATSDRVDQIMLLGDDRKFVGALIVPNFDRLRQWVDREDVDVPDSRDELCDDDHVRAWVGEAVDEVNATLDPVERVKQFALVPHEWTAENELLTPSMKKKRRSIEEAYADQIEWVYSREEPSATA